MVKKVVDYYEVSVKMLVRKDFWDADNDVMDNDTIHDRIQSGMEVPVESMEIAIKK
jgi:hypothetical protein